MSGVTIQQRLADTGGRPAGFDYLRIFLACGIFTAHAFSASYGRQVVQGVLDSPFRPIISLMVPMFFALSGFLVSGSLDRNRTMITFLGLRGFRIFPALIAEVTISALIIGPIFTTCTLRQYFSNRMFFHYLLNIIGDIHYNLPGLFLGNPGGSQVNSQLWTVPFELECYIAIAILAVLGVAKRRVLLLILTALFQIIWAGSAIRASHGVVAGSFDVTVPGRVLVLSFLTGIIVYAFKDRLRWSAWLACISFAASWALLLIHGADLFVAFPVAYFTAYMGLCTPPRAKLLQTGDYSYGIYLFGIPIQQSLAATGSWAQHVWISVAIAGPVTALMAACSWHLLEKHVLARRSVLYDLESKYLNWRSRMGSKLRIGRRPLLR